MKGRQLFILDREMLTLVGQKATQETYEDMKEMDLVRPPYAEYTIQVPMGAVIQTSDRVTLDKMAAQGDERALRLQEAPVHVFYKNGYAAIAVSNHNQTQWKTLESFLHEHMHLYPLMAQHQEQMIQMAQHIEALLIVLLATRNVQREVRHHKLVGMGIGKQKFEYVTTLKVGVIHEDKTGLPHFTGQTRRPHLRRGHVRRQRYGPSYQYIKKVFIEPVFVNGYDPDDSEHGHRRYYNVSLARGSKK